MPGRSLALMKFMYKNKCMIIIYSFLKEQLLFRKRDDNAMEMYYKVNVANKSYAISP